MSARCFCGKDHQPVAAYGAWCCPDALSATANPYPDNDGTADHVTHSALRKTMRREGYSKDHSFARKPRVCAVCGCDDFSKLWKAEGRIVCILKAECAARVAGQEVTP